MTRPFGSSRLALLGAAPLLLLAVATCPGSASAQNTGQSAAQGPGQAATQNPGQPAVPNPGQPAAPSPGPAAASDTGHTAAAPDQLVILFGDGSAAISSEGDATLDKASHLYRVGKPIVMVVTGATDSTGNPEQNLTLSERRARAVLNGLVARGIPVSKLQLLAAGSTDPAVTATSGAPEPQDRRAVITWR